MDTLEKFEVYAEQQVAELDDARSKFAVEAASIVGAGRGLGWASKKRPAVRLLNNCG
jgi:hypothetical protein